MSDQITAAPSSAERPAKPLELYWREFALALPVLGVVCIFFLARAYVSAVVLLSVTVLLVAWRVQIVERNVAGGYARARGLVMVAQWMAMAVIYVVNLGILIVANFEHWTHSRQGLVAVYACSGLAFLLAREMMRRGDKALDFLFGGEAEVEVGAALERLRFAHGWDVVHDVKRDFGNVDHLVLAPSAAFAIETKSGRESARARNQALGNAAWAKTKYGRPWVNALLCVRKDPPPTPKRVGNAWVTGLDDLSRLLETLADVIRP
jgi:hypothetical protein